MGILFKSVILVFVLAISIFHPTKLLGGDLVIRIIPVIQGVPVKTGLDFSLSDNGGIIRISRLDMLISSIGIQLNSGEWQQSEQTRQFISLQRNKLDCRFHDVPLDGVKRLRFFVGLPPELNERDPGSFLSEDPIFPVINDLHWGWQGGYVFCALEGKLRSNQSSDLLPYSFHLANDANRVPVELDIPNNEIIDEAFIEIEMNLWDILGMDAGWDEIKGKLITHSREDDPVLPQLTKAISNSFKVTKVLADIESSKSNMSDSSIRISKAHPSSTPLIIPTGKHLPPLPSFRDNPLTVEGVQLGEELFHDKNLSIDRTISCATCHDPNRAFIDPDKELSSGVEGKKGNRNSMSLVNLAWGGAFFWDGRSASLREQVLQPIQAEHEMNSSLDLVIQRLSSSEKYKYLFGKAFKDQEVSVENLAFALEQFLCAQISSDSKFDRALEGKDEFTAQEKRGLELFVTEHDPAKGLFGADCFHCHGGPLFTNHLFSNNGLSNVGGDKGREEFTGNPNDRFKFKTPTLRNISVTGPYMHDGRFKSLEEVIAHYNQGVIQSETLDPNLAKHPKVGLNLNKFDQEALVAFLKTLTDDKFARHSEE